MSKEQTDLLPCPFCGGEMQHRYALWPTEGDRDAIIHNVPGGTSCPIEGAFSIDTFDNGVSVAEAWNRRASPSPAGGVQGALLDQIEEALTGVNHALMELPLPGSGKEKRAWQSLLDAQRALTAALSSQAQTTGGE